MKSRSLRDSSVNVIDMNDVTNRMREPMNMIIIPGPAKERVKAVTLHCMKVLNTYYELTVTRKLVYSFMCMLDSHVNHIGLSLLSKSLRIAVYHIYTVDGIDYTVHCMLLEIYMDYRLSYMNVESEIKQLN